MRTRRLLLACLFSWCLYYTSMPLRAWSHQFWHRTPVWLLLLLLFTSFYLNVQSAKALLYTCKSVPDLQKWAGLQRCCQLNKIFLICRNRKNHFRSSMFPYSIQLKVSTTLKKKNWNDHLDLVELELRFAQKYFTGLHNLCSGIWSIFWNVSNANKINILKSGIPECRTMTCLCFPAERQVFSSFSCLSLCGLEILLNWVDIRTYDIQKQCGPKSSLKESKQTFVRTHVSKTRRVFHV